MSRGVMASSHSHTTFSTSIIRRYSVVVPRANPSFRHYTYGSLRTSRINLRCNSTGDSGEKNCCTSMFDAFLLGKATGEVINERVEYAVDEFLGIIGRLQADQLKHVSQFQEEVLEKARRAKELVPGAAAPVEEATQQGQELIASTITEAASTLEQATQKAQALVSEAASTVKQATEEAHGLISEATTTVEETTQQGKEVIISTISEAASTVKEAMEQAGGLVSEAASTVKEATEQAEGLVSEAASTFKEATETISSSFRPSLGVFEQGFMQTYIFMMSFYMTCIHS